MFCCVGHDQFRFGYRRKLTSYLGQRSSWQNDKTFRSKVMGLLLHSEIHCCAGVLRLAFGKGSGSARLRETRVCVAQRLGPRVLNSTRKLYLDMQWKQLPYCALLILMSTRTIVGQCPITSAPLSISDDGQNEYRDLTGLRVLLQGLPIGGQPTSVQWTHNGYKILESINEFRSHWYVGNVELHTSGPCKDRRYRVYLKVRGKQYGGIYQYSVTNDLK